MQIADLKEALETSNPIVKDECGDPNIIGKKGHVYVDGDGSFGPWFYVMVEGRDLKKRLSFMVPWQGDCVFKLDRLPTGEEAKKIRQIIGLKQKRKYNIEYADILRGRLEKFRFVGRTTNAIA